MIDFTRNLLRFPILYKTFQDTLDGGLRRYFVKDVVRPEVGDRVLDLGCGTGNLYDHFQGSQAAYLGVDHNPLYIQYAQKKYGTEGFVCEGVENLSIEKKFSKIVASSLLHHLSDEDFVGLMRYIPRLLEPGGQFIAIEPHYHPKQTWGSYWMCRLDRGRFVRTQEAYVKLLNQTFSQVSYEFIGRKSVVPTHFCILRGWN